jgi:flavin reductase (DIM6/NTAB) family NADH-FMN oxidoreductase RutF
MDEMTQIPYDLTRAFRDVAGRFATGVTVATSHVDDVPSAMTVNAFTTVSLDPMLILVCLHNSSRLVTAIRQSGVYAVSVLAYDQERVARWFATRERPVGAAAFGGISTRPAPTTGSLVLLDALAYFDCVVEDMHTSGDHTVVIGRVASFGELRPSAAPLMFVGGRFIGSGISVEALTQWPAAGVYYTEVSGWSATASAESVTTLR